MERPDGLAAPVVCRFRWWLGVEPRACKAVAFAALSATLLLAPISFRESRTQNAGGLVYPGFDSAIIRMCTIGFSGSEKLTMCCAFSWERPESTQVGHRAAVPWIVKADIQARWALATLRPTTSFRRDWPILESRHLADLRARRVCPSAQGDLYQIRNSLTLVSISQSRCDLIQRC